ncbi:MAG: hypothetical protein ACK4XJ_10940 [Fimbriimonadaceae bacterium]
MTLHRKVFLSFVAAVALFCLLIAIIIGVGMNAGQKIQAEVRAEAGQMLTKIAKPWNASELIALAAPQLLDRGGEPAIASLVENATEELGNLVDYTLTGPEMKAVEEGGERLVTAGFEADAQFEKGKGRVQFILVRIDETWKIASFTVTGDGASSTPEAG